MKLNEKSIHLSSRKEIENEKFGSLPMNLCKKQIKIHLLERNISKCKPEMEFV